MGGSAFNSLKYGSLLTPRIPNHIYHRLLSKSKLTLAQFYSKVGSSIPAPEKDHHGDLDILVEGPLGSSPTTEELQLALNATTCISSTPTSNFAIWDDQLAAYVQLDVHVCGPGRFEWECFHRAYGDLWNILGVMGKPFGVSVNDTGVRISAESIEARNRKASMLLLTESPREAIEFFGCDWTKYEKGFQTVEEFFAFCAECRFLHHEGISWKLIGRRDEGRLKEKRPLCRRWVTEYLPYLASVSGGNGTKISRSTTSRANLLEEALTKFSKWDEFYLLTANWNKELFDKEMWGRIAMLVPTEEAKVGHVIRPLKIRLKEEDEASGERGLQALDEEWKQLRESKWTDIALHEWETLLETGLEQSEIRKREGIHRSREQRREWRMDRVDSDDS